jgi:hypothetical protein
VADSRTPRGDGGVVGRAAPAGFLGRALGLAAEPMESDPIANAAANR